MYVFHVFSIYTSSYLKCLVCVVTVVVVFLFLRSLRNSEKISDVSGSYYPEDCRSLPKRTIYIYRGNIHK